jgi:hypothetical protein
MSRARRVDPLPHLAAVAQAIGERGQPQPTFAALDRALAAVLGHKLFTILRWHPDRGESERIYTNQPAAYPVGGRKPLTPTAWTRQLLDERRPYIGRTAADIREHFFDHALIASLGCASILNVPVVWNDSVLGTLNLLHEAHWYDEADVPMALTFAGAAAGAMRG